MESKPSVLEVQDASDLTPYYSISQFRRDVWNDMQASADKLVRASVERKGVSDAQKSVRKVLKQLECLEMYWAFPGVGRLSQLNAILDREEYAAFSHQVGELVRSLASNSYYHRELLEPTEEELLMPEERMRDNAKSSHYFEVLIVDELTQQEQEDLKRQIASVKGANDSFVYDVVVVPTFQDALIALSFNYNIQSCVIRYGFPFKSKNNLRYFKSLITSILNIKDDGEGELQIGPYLGEVVKHYRPELDLYFVTDTSLDNISSFVHENFRRIYYRQEDFQELHLSILRGIQERFETPFFSALKSYSQRPTGVFHAMPISRGNSVYKSNWIQEMGEFYGRNIFLAETSATTGGLDSLLQPTGPLKKAQEFAARAFGAKQTFFVTNGTSTANKIVLQALVQPGDVILIDRDCHKSHHYAMVLSGAHPVYLDSFPIEQYSMYGGVPLEDIKERLLEFKAAGRIDKVKMLVLTNCTFDGFVYNVERVMEEILAIKPDMIFLWDEAWFGFARFTRLYRQRTAMNTAAELSIRYQSEEYRAEYKTHLEGLQAEEVPLLPDPEKVKVRVYATQSTHKTLTSLRQGSMIHIRDQDFKRKVEDSFHEAYMTHTSTSPSYQILASLDVGRMQTELEGKELVEKSIERAMILRVKIANTPLLKKYFDILTVEDFIPRKFRKSGFKRYYDPEKGWSNWERSWKKDEFVLDPTKINLFIGRTGIDGDTFKREYLMDQFGIQVNKTSRNTVLFMTNIGTTRSSVAQLVSVLLKIARQIEDKAEAMNSQEQKIRTKKIASLTKHLPELPDFSHFHAVFRPNPGTLEGDIRKAYFLAYEEDNCEYLQMESCESGLRRGREIVSASFVIPYPPGFPVLVPGQVVTKEILSFMKALDVTEIHSYNPELGFRVFADKKLREWEQSSKIATEITTEA